MNSFAPIFLTMLATGLSTNALRAAQPYAIVDTGQTKCYDNRSEIAPPKPGQLFYGQDAQFRGHPSRTALPAGCSPAAPAMLRWSLEGASKGVKGIEVFVMVARRSRRCDEFGQSRGAFRGFEDTSEDETLRQAARFNLAAWRDRAGSVTVPLT